MNKKKIISIIVTFIGIAASALVIIAIIRTPKNDPADIFANDDSIYRSPFESRTLKRTDFNMEFEERDGETSLFVLITPRLTITTIAIEVKYFDRNNNLIKTDIRTKNTLYRAQLYRIEFPNTQREWEQIYRYEAKLVSGKRA